MRSVRTLSESELKRERKSLWLKLVGLVVLATLPSGVFILLHITSQETIVFQGKILVSTILMTLSAMMLYDFRPGNKHPLLLRLLELSHETDRRSEDKNRRVNTK